MGEINVLLRASAPRSYRAARLLGTLDDGRLETLETRIRCDAPPDATEEWRLGLILGPSGSGKTTVARRVYGSIFDARRDWREDVAAIDAFDSVDYETLERALSAVGFGSPPRQLLPYAALSGGERVRVDLARALLEARARGGIAVVDEFAGLLDAATRRSAAIATRRALDLGVFGAARLVAISGRDELAEELEPDWVLDMRDGRVRRGRLRRRPIELGIVRAPRELWNDFKALHYLSGSLNPSAQCFAARLLETGEEVGFAALLPSEGRRGRRRVHRLAVRADRQGQGLGGAFLDALGELCRDEFGTILEIVAGLPFFARRLRESAKWREKYVYPYGRTQRHKGRAAPGSFGRAIASFEFLGDAPPSSEEMEES